MAADALAEALQAIIDCSGHQPSKMKQIARAALAARSAEPTEDTLAEALKAASDDARILIRDYYSGLPEHRAPVDAAVARLAHLFERDDQECKARTISEVVTEGLAARAALTTTKGA